MSHDTDTIDDLLETFAVHRDAVENRPRSTIRPPATAVPDAGKQAMAAFLRAQDGRADAALLTGETLGQGGMGIVRLAEQVSLGRTVALKTLRPVANNERNALMLLREGWVTGLLQHPNIVPVHDAGLGPDGVPYLLLKRIEGDEWAALMRDADAVRDRFGADDLLEWNCQILLAVSNALRFAHSRGIVHRDLKPENVMIGAFGEVYLLDWGVAVSLRPDEAGRLPVHAVERTVAGTPAYMAPEMLRGKADELTDIYLLGAMLYEVLTGRPPHHGANLTDMLEHIRTGVPELPTDGPAELRALCDQTLARDPQTRPQTVGDFAAAITDHLGHRAAAALADEAGKRVEELESLFASDDVNDKDVHRIFAEARFGFRQSLRDWPDNDEARAALTAVTERMVAYEIDCGRAHAAELMLEDLDHPPDELVARLHSLSEYDTQQARMARRALRDQDATFGARGRILVLVGVAMVFVIAQPVLPIVLDQSPVERTYQQNMFGGFGFIAAVVAMGVFQFQTLVRSALNQAAYGLMLLAPVGQVALNLGCMALDIPASEVTVLHMLWWSAIGLAAAAAVDGWFVITALAFAVAFVATTQWRESIFWWMSGAELVFVLNVVWLWWPRGEGE